VIERLEDLAREFLGVIEHEEARLLSWGCYDVVLSADEIRRLLEESAPEEVRVAWRSLTREGWEAEDLLDDMERAGLLYRVVGSEDRYRSRFAEGVRLLVHLRQMFRAQDWASGPRLVSDLKLHLTPRRYPRRDQSDAACWADVEPLCWEPDLQRAAFDALTRRADGKPYAFAGFQRRAFQRILGAYHTEGRSGSVVSAGTGSGKTKAFYLPAFLGLVTELAAPPESPRVVATYPRNVLLADQLREALSEAAKLVPVLAARGLRPIRFGALLGQTPRADWFENAKGYRARRSAWKRVDAGWIVPFLKSPLHPDQDLVWRDEDRRRGRTCLYRANAAAGEPDVPDGVLALTREQMQSHPPDVLFVSLEMLNREMGSPGWARAFGIGPDVPAPRLLLLDEVHAYEGVGGAQIAWVLRRWQHWARAQDLHVVGLSATLREAADHLGRVSGVPAEAVAEIRPLESEYETEGMEYNVAIKGDPASGTALLSTTIQTGMVLTRLLTPRHALAGQGGEDDLDPTQFYARKVFGFTDNLDSLNRWYSDFSDAERNLRLARHRLHPAHRTPPELVSDSLVRAIDAEGQLWELPRRLGHRLETPLQVSRCSSQDPGANAGSDVIIASASLEVGYDDPEVGAVLHHKRPTSLASFVQRKGRAGRRRGTRPWTVVILSDYGADRWAFHNAETLFQPELDRVRLPVHNPHVLRIQATYLLVDWLGHRIGSGRPFVYLAGDGEARAQQRQAIGILRELLTRGPVWEEFRAAFQSVFRAGWGAGEADLSEADLDAILWNAPRPLLREVVPTLLRKLEAEWGYADPARGGQREDRGAYRPLPHFLPSATFAELSTSETRLTFGENRDDEFLAVGRALFEVCPGRVSKRYALKVGEPGYWLGFSETLARASGLQTAPVSDLFADRLLLGSVDGVRIYEPMAAEVRHRSKQVSDQSTSAWAWRAHLAAKGEGRRMPVLESGPWSGSLKLGAFLHRDYTAIEVTRFTRSCRYEIRTQGELFRGQVLLASASETGPETAEAVGFRLHVDGLRLEIAADHLSALPPLDESIRSRFRSDYFRDQVRESRALAERINVFQGEWLWQTSIAMLSATALANDCSLEEAQGLLEAHRVTAARKVLDRIFQIRDVGGDDDVRSESRRKAEILSLWENPGISAEMSDLERSLWSTAEAEFEAWVRRRYVATLAQALRAAAARVAPDVAEDDLVVDVQWRADGGAECFLTEAAAGGLGQIERVAQEIRTDPASFEEAVLGVLAVCPRNRLSGTLWQAVRHAARPHGGQKDNALQQAFRRVRGAVTFGDQEAARDALRAALESIGLASTREVVVALNLRLLRAGTSSETDLWVRRLDRLHRRWSRRIGAAIDSRVFAYLAFQHPGTATPLTALLRSLGGAALSDTQLYNAVQHLLLPGCHDSCPECLGHPNRFHDFGAPSRDLARRWIRVEVPEVRWEAVGGRPGLTDRLRRDRRLRLIASSADLRDVASALQAIFAEELDVDDLLMPASLTGAERHGADWLLTIEISGADHG
jgi:hypothetical protein